MKCQYICVVMLGDQCILCGVSLYNVYCLPPPPPNRETMLQALRFVIQGAGSKVDPAIRKNITTTLLGMLGHDEV